MGGGVMADNKDRHHPFRFSSNTTTTTTTTTSSSSTTNSGSNKKQKNTTITSITNTNTNTNKQQQRQQQQQQQTKQKSSSNTTTPHYTSSSSKKKLKVILKLPNQPPLPPLPPPPPPPPAPAVAAAAAPPPPSPASASSPLALDLVAPRPFPSRLHHHHQQQQHHHGNPTNPPSNSSPHPPVPSASRTLLPPSFPTRSSPSPLPPFSTSSHPSPLAAAAAAPSRALSAAAAGAAGTAAGAVVAGTAAEGGGRAVPTAGARGGTALAAAEVSAALRPTGLTPAGAAPTLGPVVAAARTAVLPTVAQTTALVARASVGADLDGGDDEESLEKPSKKRKLKAVSESLLKRDVAAPVSVVHGPLSQQGKIAQARQPRLASPILSDLSAYKPDLKEQSPDGQESSRLNNRHVAHNPTSHILPSKKVLEGILDKLQKKDTYRVFSKPVDPSQVPDYYDVIKEPMDFGTMRKKIHRAEYVSLDDFQNDIFLICNNAMHYNARDTIYYKQARSIQDAARKALDGLRISSAIMEAAKLKAGGLPAKKSAKRLSVGKFRFESAGSDYISGVTLSTGGDTRTWLSSSHTEASKGGRMSTSDRSGAICGNTEAKPNSTRGIQGYTNILVDSPSDARAEQQDDMAGSLLKSVILKDGRRSLSDCRSTYRHRSSSAYVKGSVLAVVGGEHQQLFPMGCQSDYAYARSLARFAADLGPIVWRVAAEKISKSIPPGCPYGPGWVGEHEAQDVELRPSRKVQLMHHTDSREAVTTASSQSATVKDLIQASTKDTSSNVSSVDGGSSNPLTLGAAVSAPPTRTCYTAMDNPTFSTANVLSEDTRTPEHRAKSVQHLHQSSGEPVKFSFSGANFAPSVSQSKLLEMVSQNSKLVSWTSGKQAERAPISASRSQLPVVDQYARSTVHDGNMGMKEASENAKIVCMSNSTAAVSSLDNSEHTLGVEGNSLMWASHSVSSQDNCIQNLNLQVAGSLRQEGLHSNPIASSGVSNALFSTSASVGPAMCREDTSMQFLTRPQRIDLSHAGSNARTKPQSQLTGTPTPIQREQSGAYYYNPQHQVPQTRVEHQQHSQLPGNPVQRQSGYDTQLQGSQASAIHQQSQLLGNRMQSQLPGTSCQSTLLQDSQMRLGHQQQHDHQARLVSQLHENQRLYLQHQFSSDIPPHVQQQLVLLHSQVSTKPVTPPIHSGGSINCELQDQSMLNLHAHFSSPMVVGGAQCQNQPWRFVATQYPLQQATNLSRSLPPDLNVSLPAPKSPLKPPLNKLTESQQPDLALQL